jgi:predicted dehydrogenase
MIRAGVIGAGFIGPAHVEAVRRLGSVEVVALAASSLASAQKKAQALSIARAYGDWRELVHDPDVQVVHNCTPNVMHHEVTLAAIAAGKHIVAEKPLAMNSRETSELVQALEATPLVGAVCFNYRMYPLVQEARARVAAGDIGQVRLIHGGYLQDWLLFETDYNWRVDPRQAGASRAMADIGSHWCDLAQFVSGRRIAAVCADLGTFLPRRFRPAGEVETFAGPARRTAGAVAEISVETEDYGSVLLRYDGGARGACTISQLSAGHKNGLRLEVDGSLSSLA